MNNNFIEIEIKYPLRNPEIVIDKLSRCNAQMIAKAECQKDVYYVPQSNNFLEKKPVDEWFRLRQTSTKAYLNYKKWLPENSSEKTHCTEYEIEVGDFKIAKKMLESLNFKIITVVNKMRSTFKIKNVLLSIDFVESLGCFIECEDATNLGCVKKAQENFKEVLELLSADVGPLDSKGYPLLLLEAQNTTEQGSTFDKNLNEKEMNQTAEQS